MSNTEARQIAGATVRCFGNKKLEQGETGVFNVAEELKVARAYLALEAHCAALEIRNNRLSEFLKTAIWRMRGVQKHWNFFRNADKALKDGDQG